jgi:hypothetical protein
MPTASALSLLLTSTFNRKLQQELYIITVRVCVSGLGFRVKVRV